MTIQRIGSNRGFGRGPGNRDIFQVLKGLQRSNFPTHNRDKDDN